jgi:hypothetical protein
MSVARRDKSDTSGAGWSRETWPNFLLISYRVVPLLLPTPLTAFSRQVSSANATSKEVRVQPTARSKPSYEYEWFPAHPPTPHTKEYATLPPSVASIAASRICKQVAGYAVPD